MIIKAPAISKNGKIYTGGFTHDEIIFDSSRPRGFLTDGVKGFITDTNKFVNRVQAAKIAYESGQINERIGILFSCDISFESKATEPKETPRPKKKKQQGIDDEEFFS